MTPCVAVTRQPGRVELSAELRFDGPAEVDPPAAGAGTGAGLQLTGDVRSLIFDAM